MRELIFVSTRSSSQSGSDAVADAGEEGGLERHHQARGRIVEVVLAALDRVAPGSAGCGTTTHTTTPPPLCSESAGYNRGFSPVNGPYLRWQG